MNHNTIPVFLGYQIHRSFGEVSVSDILHSVKSTQVEFILVYSPTQKYLLAKIIESEWIRLEGTPGYHLVQSPAGQVSPGSCCLGICLDAF